MTSFQRLLRGLQVLNRYSGITEVQLGLGSVPIVYGNPVSMSIPGRLTVPVPLTLDSKDVTALTKLGWSNDGHNWVFRP